MTCSPRTGGFSLVEALVALVITSFLMVVFMKMAWMLLVRTQESRTRAFAIHQMQSMAASVSANRGYWARKSPTPAPLDTRSVTRGDDCEARQCTVEQLARYDVARWGEDLAARLTSPAGIVTCTTPEEGATCAIDLSWRERGAPQTDARPQLTLRFTP